MSKQWINKGWDVFIPGGGFSLRNCPDPVDNATRIVECVNACAGMSDPAEDIATLKRQRDELTASLEKLYRGYVHVLEAGRDRIMDLGGDCDPLDVMEDGDHLLRDMRGIISKVKGCSA